MNRIKYKILLLVLIGIFYISTDAWASIILKAVVVNPSKTRTQKAILKAYLPKEARAEDVINLGDLKIDYDITQALYFVYKEVELGPGESAVRSVEISDVWVISKSEIDALTGEAKELVERLKKTGYFDTAVTLQEDIEKTAKDILQKQEDAMESVPQTHIAIYRSNVQELDVIKKHLSNLDEMAVKAKLTEVKEGSGGEGVGVKATWGIILGVIITLGVLSFIFFIIWHRQAGIAELEIHEIGKDKTEPDSETPPSPEKEKT